jgi:hypothetical protein
MLSHCTGRYQSKDPSEMSEAEPILSAGKRTCLLEQLSEAQADHAVRRCRIGGTRVTVWNHKSGDETNRV